MSGHEAGSVRPIDDRPLVIFLILIAAMVATPLAVGLVLGGGRQTEPGPAAQNLLVVAQEAVLASLTVWRLRRLGVPLASLRALVDDAAVALRGLAGGFNLLVANLLCSQLSVLIFTVLLGQERLMEWLARERGAMRRLLDPEIGLVHLGIIVFLAVGVAPFVEELFFRGYAYPVLKHHIGRHASWASALIFAAVHLYVVNFLPVFVIGLLLVRLYERTGSLAAAILAHATANGAVAILALWAERLLG